MNESHVKKQMGNEARSVIKESFACVLPTLASRYLRINYFCLYRRIVFKQVLPLIPLEGQSIKRKKVHQLEYVFKFLNKKRVPFEITSGFAQLSF